MIPWHGGLRGCAVDVSRGSSTVREDSLGDKVLLRCREHVQQYTVALNWPIHTDISRRVAGTQITDASQG